ncbi:MAG: PAS domain S-box protein [Gemmatimonadota bacterium]
MNLQPPDPSRRKPDILALEFTASSIRKAPSDPSFASSLSSFRHSLPRSSVTIDPTRAAERRLRAAVESSPSGLLMTDAQGRIVLVNREIERLFGYSREEILGKSVDVLVPERFRGAHPAFRAGYVNAPEVRAMGTGRDLFGLRKDGTEVPVEIGLTPVGTEEGLFILSSIVDISSRKRAEARFKVAVESSPNGMVMIDGTGLIVLVNREVERMFGYPRDELLGQTIELLVPSRFREKHPAYRTSYFDDPRARLMGAGRELFGVRKDGSEIPVEIGLNPIETEEGIFVLGSIVDISARKQAEGQHRLLEEQLRQAQKMEAVGTLAGGIAHDFNNILGAIFGYAELIRDNTEDEQARTDSRELLKAAYRGKQLVERILTFSRRQEIVRRPLALDNVLTEAIKLLRATLPAAIEIKFQPHGEVPKVLADSTCVHHVLMNLCANSAYAMPAGGTLVISVDPFYIRDSIARARPDLHEGTYAVLSVTDTGTGMDAGTQARVFEPFFTTKAIGQGTGLGLAMVHGIMQTHDGAVELESDLGKGTTVRCLFPAISTEAEIEIATDPEYPRGHGEHILVVDDEPSLVHVSERRLTALGYKVTTETNSVQALARFQEDPSQFDLVLADYSMPQLSGIELARAVVALRPDIPIAMLTGFTDGLSAGEAEAVGVRQLLKKPVTSRDLACAMKDLLERH